MLLSVEAIHNKWIDLVGVGDNLIISRAYISFVLISINNMTSHDFHLNMNLDLNQ